MILLTEALGSTDAAFLSEVKQLNKGKSIPVIVTSATISPDFWFKSGVLGDRRAHCWRVELPG